MEQQQVAESSPLDVKTAQSQAPMEPQTEPQVDADVDASNKNKKKKKKKKKNRRKSLERTPSEVEEMQAKQPEDKPEPEEEGDENETNQKQEETAVTEEASIEETTVETEEKKEGVQHDDVLAEASGNELGPPSLERQSSLDSFKATGTRAVGSLFSRFKVGRKKPLPSRTESVAKLELANPSPVKTAVKRLEVPEEKNLDDLPMRTKRDFFGEGEQSIHVSAEKDKYDAMEKQRKSEKEAEEAAKVATAAKQTPPSSSRSDEDLLAMEEEDVASSSFVEESVETEVSEVKLTSVSGNSSTVESSEVVASEASETVVNRTTELAPATPAVESVVLEASESKDDQVATTNVVTDNITVLAADTMVETNQQITDATTTLPASLKLDLDLAINTETTESSLEEVEEVVVDNEEASIDAVASNEIVQDEAPSIKDAEKILPVKVARPTPELAAEVPTPAEPERMSPVKSLASRFEGKREQSLDSLKFRTVREFFSEERSIRVGAEKQKYEALTEQQKLKDKAEEKAKSKYNTSKSPVKERDFNAIASVDEDSTVASDPAAEFATATSAEAVKFSTPETVIARKKFSFDEGYAATNSPAKFSDDASEALTPVKSIASRFEGKREQSLDNLKFRTVREFFPEERSVRVGSEKQKFEAQAQQENSLDKLKFRTVREFFPSESKRSIHVGAEKAKFEALTKQQDEAAKAAEQMKLKHATLSPAPPVMKIESHDADPASPVTNVTSTSTLDVKVELSSAVSALEANDDAVVEPVEESAPVGPVTDGIPSSVTEDLTPTEFSQVKEAVPLPSNAGESVSKEEIVAPDILTNQVDANECVVLIEPAVAGDGKYITIDNSEASQGSAEVIKLKIEQEVEQEFKQPGEHEVKNPVKQDAEQNIEIETEQELEHEVESQLKEEAEQEISQEIDQEAEERPGGDIKLDCVNLDEPIVDTQVEPTFDAAPVGTDLSEHTILDTVSAEQKSVEIVEQKVDGEVADDLVELDLGEPVEGEPVNPAVPTVSDIIDTSAVQGVDTQQLEKDQESAKGSQQAVESVQIPENGLFELDLGEPIAEKCQVDSSQQIKCKSRPMLTTERSFVMEDDHTIETEDTVVVSERPMTDGEDEFEPLSLAKARPAHELFAGITSSSTEKSSTSTKKISAEASDDAKMSPKLTHKVSAGSTGSAKSSTTVPVPMKRASITAPTASSMAKKAAEAENLHRSSPQLKKQSSASKLKGTVSDTGFIKPPPAAPTVPVPMKRASITAPTASYVAKAAAEAEKAHRASPQPRQHNSASKQKATVSETGFIKPPPAAPTVPVPMKRASITAPTASWQARHVPDHAGVGSVAHPASKNHTSNVKATVGPTGFVKPTVPVAPKRASILVPTASYMAKKAVDNAEENSAAISSVPARNKRYSNVKSKVMEGIDSKSMHAASHKTITKEEFIAAERRKSLGSAGVRSVLDAVDRRASLTARVTIDGPPEPFMRSAFSRKKLESTVPRYMNYENTPGYTERARQQYERRKRLEEENAAKSEKRQRELRMHFAEKQQKALVSTAEEVRRGLEAHEFSRLVKESEVAAQISLRKENQRALSTRSHHRASSTTSGSSSNGFASRVSKKSSVSSVEEKIVAVPTVELTVLETEEELVDPATVETVESVEPLLVTQMQEIVIEAAQVEEQVIPVPVVDEDPTLEHVAKKIDFDEASSDSDEENAANE